MKVSISSSVNVKLSLFEYLSQLIFYVVFVLNRVMSKITLDYYIAYRHNIYKFTSSYKISIFIKNKIWRL